MYRTGTCVLTFEFGTEMEVLWEEKDGYLRILSAKWVDGLISVEREHFPSVEQVREQLECDAERKEIE